MRFSLTFLKSHTDRQGGTGKLAVLAILLVLLAGMGIAAAHRQDIWDWVQLRNYQASPQIARLADQDTMTAYAKKVFYVNHPDIAEKTEFTKSCPANGGEQTIVLGCYHGGQGGIFILNVTDTRLNGVEQVTAAHEMLHAAYDRLSAHDRSQVNAMLMDYYQHGLHDERLQKTIDAYKKTEPHDVVNEMHSIFGTEVAKLPSGLEAYYKQYFTNRAAVAGYAGRYQEEFTSRQTAVAQDDARLSSLKSQIEADEADLKSKAESIQTQRNTLLNQRNAGNVTAYNAGVPAYNSLIDTYNTEVRTVQSLISQYNQLVQQRNAIALEVDQLVDDLNAKVAPIQQ